MNPQSWTKLSDGRRFRVILFGLVAATALPYWRLAFCDFVNYDDPGYVYANPAVTSGLTCRGIIWALFTNYYDFWHPLTWWSHMFDCELFGTNSAFHHLVNLGFHVANAALVFSVFSRATGKRYRSLLVAGLFALHPLHVESVAWVSERKDVLSCFFGLLSLRAYLLYAESGKPLLSSRYYRFTCLFFALALMAKAMLVTLPFILLLLDYWPLKRLESGPDIGPRVREKIPLFGMSFASCVITYLGMHAGQNVLSSERIPWGLRIANAAVSYVQYLSKLFWPFDLAVLYPMPKSIPWSQVTVAVVLLLGISVCALLLRHSKRYFLFGWLFFLGTLVPVIGIVAMGSHSFADRYTYIPAIGIFVVWSWGLADFAARSKWRAPVIVMAGVILICFGWRTDRQARYWRNSETLWTHCLEIDPQNAIAEYNLGHYLQHTGRTELAILHYQQALRLKPQHLDANLNLAAAYTTLQQYREATNYYALALQLKPDYEKALSGMGHALYQLKEFAGASNQLVKALALYPENGELQGLYQTVLSEWPKSAELPDTKP